MQIPLHHRLKCPYLLKSTMKPAVFKDKVVLITGASSGIGRALAMAFSVQGAQVALVARTEAHLRDVEQQLTALPGRRLVIPADVRNPQQVEHVVQTVMEQFKRVDVLVNNAGKGYCGELADMTAADMYDLFETNFFGPFHFYRSVVPHMIQRRSGLIIQVSSVSGFCAVPLGGAYCATKFALEAMSDSARLELQSHNIRVLVVRPGVTNTSFFDHAKNFRVRNPFSLSRMMSPDTVARQVVQAAASGRRECVLTAEAKISYWLKRIAPRLLDHIIIRYVKPRPTAPAR